MANYYCEYCGTKSTSVFSLTGSSCIRHPKGEYKGKHKLYEGSEKAQYTCKYCGTNAHNIATLTAMSCPHHPDGAYKGKHAVAL